MNNKVLDILLGKKSSTGSLAPVSSPVGGAVTTAPSPAALGTSSVIERFRSVTSSMRNTANNSIRQEIERIITLPIIPDPTEEEIALVSKHYCPDGTFILYPEQVKAMMMYHEYGGMILPMAVGSGKTLVGVLVANDAYSIFGKRKILLMCPPTLVGQLRDTELPYYRRHISINVPFYWIASLPPGKRMLQAKSKRSGVYVVSYSLLSGRKGAEILEAIEPDLIIGDEIHKIASANPSARGRRFKEVVQKYQPQIEGLSGTITKKTPKDYHFLISHALQENCPMPRPVALADEWSKLIDSEASSIDEFSNNSAPQLIPFKMLISWAKKNFPLDAEQYPNNLIGFRAAYKTRLRTCPGVVASDGEDIGVSLRITNIDSKEKHDYNTKLVNEESNGWEKLRELVDQLTEYWIAPNGDEIDHAMHMWRWRFELEGFGFFNNLFWPSPEKIAERKKLLLKIATDIVDRSKQHHLLQQEYHRLLRSWITKRARKSLDTPFLIGGEMARTGSKAVGQELYKAWSDMKSAVFPEMIERDKEFVRVCNFRVKKIIEWAKEWHKNRPDKAAIVWYVNNGVAEWLRDAFMEADLPYLYCPAGKKGLSNIEDRTQGDKFAIASLKAYNEGLNLQYHHDAEMFAQWPREALLAQQGMGRVHRNEQASEEVRIFGSFYSEFDRINFAACLNDSAYIHQTTQKQKLLYADYDERPTVLPHSVLMEWGTQAIQLGANRRRLLEDKFKGE